MASSVTYRVSGGKVDVYFANGRVAGLSSSDPTFRFPDGVTLGKVVPYRAVGRKWNGYTRCAYLVSVDDPNNRVIRNFAPNGWAKKVTLGKLMVVVRLSTRKQRVTYASLDRYTTRKPYRFANVCRLD